MTSTLLVLLLGCRQTLMPDRPIPTDDPTDDWATVLAEVVTQEGYVDYDILEQNQEVLHDYVLWVSRDELFGDDKVTAHHHAFYINVFNAFAMYQVLENNRPASILDIQGWIPTAGSGFFLTTQFDVAQDHQSLQEIRDERIRWKEMDYRSHGAMVFGARGAPPLSPELYGFGELNEQLRAGMTRWLQDPERGVRVEDGVAQFNPIFNWYARDFDFFSASLDLCTLAARHTSGELKQQLQDLADSGCPHDFYEFDWRLNEAL